MTALGLLALGHMWLRIAKAAIASNAQEGEGAKIARLARARFFMSRQLAGVATCLERVKAERDDLIRLPVDAF
jgi:hypothetical protein